MFDFLENFEKRMEWIGVANTIINRKGRNLELEGLFGENELTNVIISVLLFIMEKTLEENNECELYQIEGFIDDLVKNYYRVNLDRSTAKALASYIIRDILQNNGVKLTYPLMNYTKKCLEEINIRLVADKIVEEDNVRKIIYMLTNQGYEFLFRMREVDEEIQLTIEQLKLKEYIKRKKFSSAVRQSVELINYVRQKKKDIENFILLIRQNIQNADVEHYEALIKSTYAMLTEEYETMTDILKMIRMAEEKIKEEFAAGKDFETRLSKAKVEIQEIHHNIGIVITEQRDLIINRHSLSDLYMDTIKKSFDYSFEKRFDFEEVVLANFERYNNVLDRCLLLIKPLFLPNKEKLLGIGDIYEPQIIYKEIEKLDSHMVDIEEFDRTKENERIRKISNGYVEVMKLILTNAIRYGQVSLSSIIKKIQGNYEYDVLNTVLENKYIFLTALKLYDFGSIPIAEFFSSNGRVILKPSEEFNIEYCLTVLKDHVPGLNTISELIIEKADTEIKVSFERNTDGVKFSDTIEMTDLIFRV